MQQNTKIKYAKADSKVKNVLDGTEKISEWFYGSKDL